MSEESVACKAVEFAQGYIYGVISFFPNFMCTECAAASFLSGVFPPRSAYFRLGTLIKERIPSKAILALTATATESTQRSIKEVLNIPPEGSITESELPRQLHLAVQMVNPGKILVSSL